MAVMQEFKQFIMRGNVLDLAVGVVIGAAFSKIVSSLVSDLLMPPLGLVIGQVDFSNLFIDLSGHHYATLAAAKAAGAPTLNLGLFCNNVLDFLIIAFSIFLVVKGVNALARRQPAAAPTPPPLTASEKLLGEIRDLLTAQTQMLTSAEPAAASELRATRRPAVDELPASLPS